MTHPKNDVERLQSLIDAVEESILSASDEEIVEDVRLEGRDPQAAAGAVRSMIGAQIKAQRQQKLKAARAGYVRTSTKIRSPLARLGDPAARRTFLDNLLSRRDDLPDGLTMAFREGKEMSDDDVSSLLDDLANLGLLEEDEER